MIRKWTSSAALEYAFPRPSPFVRDEAREKGRVFQVRYPYPAKSLQARYLKRGIASIKRVVLTAILAPLVLLLIFVCEFGYFYLTGGLDIR